MTCAGHECREALERLYLLLDHETDDATCEEIRAHLDSCADCLDAFDLEVLVKSLVSRSCQERAPEPLRQRVLYSIRTVEVQMRRLP